MSVITKLSTIAYYGFVIGRSMERRRKWMERARELKVLGYDVTISVRAARHANREIVEHMRLLKGAQS
jgi:hypothetical protein